MKTKNILEIAIDALESMKAEDMKVLNVEHLTDLMSDMVVCTATSVTHSAALAEHLQKQAKAFGLEILGVEGKNKSDWVLVDLGDVVVHIMSSETRALYQLEKLWDIRPNTPQEN